MKIDRGVPVTFSLVILHFAFTSEIPDVPYKPGMSEGLAK